MDELELSEGEEPAGLPVGGGAPRFELPGADASLTLREGSPRESPIEVGREDRHGLAGFSGEAGRGGTRPDRDQEERASRFGNRSLARSKLKRDGLKAGTPAPDFHLPRLDGRCNITLSKLRGKRVLLVFCSPGCSPCNTLAPELETFHRAHPELELVMISKGEPKENRAKVKEFSLTFPILLQQQWEISPLYAMFATPIFYLVDEAGVILQHVAVGTEGILNLMALAAAGVDEYPTGELSPVEQNRVQTRA